MNQTLLVELLTEELPPKALNKLGAAFAAGIEQGLKSRDFLSAGSVVTAFATPRRLAVTITEVAAVSPDKTGRHGPRRRHRRPARTRPGRQGRELFLHLHGRRQPLGHRPAGGF